MDDALQTDDIEVLRRLAKGAWERAEALAAEKALAVQEKEVAEAKLSTLENELTVLLAQIADLTVKLANANNRDSQLALELQLHTLRKALSQNAETMYGATSERRKKGRDKNKNKNKNKGDQKGHGPTEQPGLPIETCVFELEGENCSCLKCGSDLRVLGECFEESEVIASVRRSFVLREIKRTKYACKSCGDIRTAPGPFKHEFLAPRWPPFGRRRQP